MNPEVIGANPDNPINRVHPIMILGIFVFVSPYLGTALKINLPGWFSGVGIAMILLGVGLTVLKGGR